MSPPLPTWVSHASLCLLPAHALHPHLCFPSQSVSPGPSSCPFIPISVPSQPRHHHIQPIPPPQPTAPNLAHAPRFANKGGKALELSSSGLDRTSPLLTPKPLGLEGGSKAGRGKRHSGWGKRWPLRPENKGRAEPRAACSAAPGCPHGPTHALPGVQARGQGSEFSQACKQPCSSFVLTARLG